MEQFNVTTLFLMIPTHVSMSCIGVHLKIRVRARARARVREG
jgi:hypothetical protein